MIEDIEYEVTPTERIWLVVIAFVSVILSIAISIAVYNSTSFVTANMQKAIRLTDNDQFGYAIDTQYAGGIWGQGLVSLPLVSEPHLSAQFGEITSHEQKYTRHTYTTCSTVNKVTTCTEHVYYSWDSHGDSEYISPTFTFMGHEFNTSQIDVQSLQVQLVLNNDNVLPEWQPLINDNYIYKIDRGWWGASVGDIRWYFTIIPQEIDGVMYIRSTSSGLINESDKPCGCSISHTLPDDRIKIEQNKGWFMTHIFVWLFPLLVIVGFGWYFLTNEERGNYYFNR